MRNYCILNEKIPYCQKTPTKKDHVCSCIRIEGPIGDPNEYNYIPPSNFQEKYKDYFELFEIDRPERYTPGEICFYGESNAVKQEGYLKRLKESGSSYAESFIKHNPEKVRNKNLDNETTGCKLIHSRKLEIDGIKCVKDPKHECYCPHLHHPKPLESISWKIRNEIVQLPNRILLQKEEPPPFWWRGKSTKCLRPLGNPDDYSFKKISYVDNEFAQKFDYPKIFQIERPERYIPGYVSSPSKINEFNRTEEVKNEDMKEEKKISSFEQERYRCKEGNICHLCRCPKNDRNFQRCKERPGVICMCPDENPEEELPCFLETRRDIKHDFVMKRLPKNYHRNEGNYYPPCRPKPKTFPDTQAKCLTNFY